MALAVGGWEDGWQSDGDQLKGRLQTIDVPAAFDSDGNGARPWHQRMAMK